MSFAIKKVNLVKYFAVQFGNGNPASKCSNSLNQLECNSEVSIALISSVVAH